MEYIEIDTASASNEKWREIMTEKLRNASHFEIHCWNEEGEEIETALQYGTLKECDWKYGKVIAGEVTANFVNFLLSQPEPAGYDKMTPFFSIFLDNGFSSEHYGTELIQQSRGS